MLIEHNIVAVILIGYIFLQENYPDNTTGISCERFCSLSKILELSTFLSYVGSAFYTGSSAMCRIFNFGNEFGFGFVLKSFCVSLLGNSSYIMPHQAWVNSGNNIADFSKNPNLSITYLSDVLPENDPTRVSKWNGPFYPSYGCGLSLH